MITIHDYYALKTMGTDKKNPQQMKMRDFPVKKHPFDILITYFTNANVIMPFKY